MKILIVGSGGREHAIGWKLKNEGGKDISLFFAPGNGGTSSIGTNINLDASDINGIAKKAEAEQIDLVFVGPEVPLALGIVDLLVQKNIAVFGPDKSAARLESSKNFAKEFMLKYDVPTAKYTSFQNAETALDALETAEFPLVIKADGLAAGKGVYICEDKASARNAIAETMQEKVFGDSGESIIFEEFLQGKEVSLLCFVDGETIIPLEAAADYKRIGEGDSGLNTGGMGAVSPVAYCDKATATGILQNTLKGIKAEGFNYKGVIFIGLMINEKGCFVLEYNVRFGDPETEVLMPRLESNLLELLLKTVNGQLHGTKIKWSDQPAVTVVLAAGGYPEKHETGFEISRISDEESHAVVFHCGTKLGNNGKLITNGGRVLAVSAKASSIKKARERAYKKANEIEFEGRFFRSDIGLLRDKVD